MCSELCTGLSSSVVKILELIMAGGYLFTASCQGNEDGRLHGLRRLIDDDDVKGARHLAEGARAAEAERAAHDGCVLQHLGAHDVALGSARRALPALQICRQPSAELGDVLVASCAQGGLHAAVAAPLGN